MSTRNLLVNSTIAIKKMLPLSLSLNPNFLHSCSLQTGVFFCVMNTVFNYSLLFKGLSYINWLIFESIFLLSFSD